MHALLLALATLSLHPPAPQVSIGGGSAAAQPATAEFSALTEDLSEGANFHPEPFTGLAFDADGAIYAVNPYESTFLKYASPSAAAPALRVRTGLNPVSIAIWNQGPSLAERRVLVLCTGSHALFLHAADDGRVLDALALDSEPADLVLDADNGWAFASCRGDDTVVRIDLASFSIGARYEIGCGQRPGPLHLDRGNPAIVTDNRVYVAPMVTGNNTTVQPGVGPFLTTVVRLDNQAVELPDEDVFRIDAFAPQASAVTSAVRRAGSLIFALGRNPSTRELWVLSTDSLNDSAANEPALNGQFALNQLVRLAGVTATSALVTGGAGIDLDDYLPFTPGAQYATAQSLNQARALAFQSDGEGFVASPFRDLVAELDTQGRRVFRYDLPARAQCYDLAVYPPNEATLLALCLGTMTIEVFSEGTGVPGTPLSLGNDPTPAHVRAGRDLFSDGSLSKDGRFTCFSCHEGGRTDMLGWPLAGTPNDEKDLMVTQSLLGIADTFPHHWRGERDLGDFQKAFAGLLGAPDGLDADPAAAAEKMQDVVAFVHALRAPANPHEALRRRVDDTLTGGAAPNGLFGFPVKGQELFLGKQNFNGNTCAECHEPHAGSNSNLFFEVASFVPRAQELEVAHLRQLQHKGEEFLTLASGQVVNENGFGASHNGVFPSVFHFIDSDANFPQLSPLERTHVAEFVKQFDSGTPPGAQHVVWLDPATSQRDRREIDTVLIAGAEQGWLDLAVFGRFDDGAGPVEVRWLYDPLQDLFVNEHPLVGDKSWPQFQAAAAAGAAHSAFVGLPLGNGRRYAFDGDADDASDGTESAVGTDPWLVDTDQDGWPDGFELENGENPLVAQGAHGDDARPQLVSASREFASARLAKFHVRFSEDARYVVQYSLPGGPVHSFEQEDLVRADTFVLTHSSPSRPLPTQENKPAPDGNTVFSATITLFDRAGKQGGPYPLGVDFTPLANQVQLGLLSAQLPYPFVHSAPLTVSAAPTGPDSLTATVTVFPDTHVDAPNYLDADGLAALLSISVQDPSTGLWSQSSDFTSAQKVNDVPLFDTAAAAATTLLTLTGTDLTGPFGLSAPSTLGATSFTFSKVGLVPGQKLKIVLKGFFFPVPTLPGFYEAPSVFLLQPLLTEDAHEVELTF
jgi:hypothetical protein